jgi:DNA-directed RNA polymerase subunit RPC12/RpoP
MYTNLILSGTYFMEDYQVVQESDQEKSDDHIWRQFFEHSYAVQYKCPQCGADFDIDGWFFKFEPVRCSKCGLKFQGLFGRVMSSSSSSSGQIDLETFEGDQGSVSIPHGSFNLSSIVDHIILILYAEKDPKNPVPFGLIDYFAQKPRFHYFGKPDNFPSGQQKPKSIFATLFS